MKDLIYNEDTFVGAQRDLNKVMEDFITIKNGLGEDINLLNEEAWNSNAGKVFLETFKDTWSPTLNQYIDMMKVMTDTLAVGQEKYNGVREEIIRTKYLKEEV